jgi:hypothetical protein
MPSTFSDLVNITITDNNNVTLNMPPRFGYPYKIPFRILTSHLSESEKFRTLA